jgi:hypothetical protein
MGALTVLYYSSNVEKPDFEKKIIANLVKSTDLPIISVTQKPTKLGRNICVGEIGNSYINEYQQILVGLKEIKTEYYISAEADYLYPTDYFTFEPDGENIYRSNNVWIVFNKGGYRKKPYSEGAQIANTKYMIKFIEWYLDGLPKMFNGRPSEADPFYHTYMKHQKALWKLPFTFFETSPCLSFKTGNGVRKGTNVVGEGVSDLYYWGNINYLREQYGQQTDEI